MLTELAAIAGLITGSASLGVSAANFFRDRSRIRVTLTFDMQPTESLRVRGFNADAYIVVSVANIGRRPIFVSHVALCAPRRKTPILFLGGSQTGSRIAEGDPPWSMHGAQDEALHRFAPDARVLRAVVIDSANRRYYSRPVARPSFAGKALTSASPKELREC